MIEINNLRKSFGSKIAVQNISLEISEGEILVLLGPNGAGKTTVIRLLSSLLKPDGGFAKIYGYDVVDDAMVVRKIVGVLTEQPGLYQRMNIIEYLNFFGRLYYIKEDIIRERTAKFVKLLNLMDETQYLLETFSKGTRQKVSLARSLIHNPNVIFLDEPTSALDPYSAKIVRDYIIELKKRKKIILVCTHNLTEAEYLADRVAILKGGRIIFLGTINKLREKLSTDFTYTINFIGCLNINKEEIEKKFNISIISENNDSFTYIVRNFNVNAELLKYLIESGFKVVSCELNRKTLEDAYLQLASDESIGI